MFSNLYKIPCGILWMVPWELHLENHGNYLLCFGLNSWSSWWDHGQFFPRRTHTSLLLGSKPLKWSDCHQLVRAKIINWKVSCAWCPHMVLLDWPKRRKLKMQLPCPLPNLLKANNSRWGRMSKTRGGVASNGGCRSLSTEVIVLPALKSN